PRSEIHLFERALAGPLAARIRRCDHRPPIRPQGVSPRPDTDRLMRASRYGNLETISHLKVSHGTAQIAHHHHRTLGHPQTASGKQDDKQPNHFFSRTTSSVSSIFTDRAPTLSSGQTRRSGMGFPFCLSATRIFSLPNAVSSSPSEKIT